MGSKLDFKKLSFQLAAFLVPFIVYLITLAPSVTFIDAGELATVCIKLGVAHPTGYPLFTIIGSLFSKLPIGEEVYRLNLMCAVISSFSVLVFFNLLVFLFTGFKLQAVSKVSPNKKSRQVKNAPAPKQVAKVNTLSIYFISLAASFILAFSLTFWETANAIEVYSLHTLFLVSVIYLMLRAAVFTNNNEENFFSREKYWLAFSFVLSLSFTNHLSTIFLAPGCLFFYFAVNGFDKNSFKRIGYMAVPFIIGLSLYSYLFLRADNPVIAWGHPDNWNNFYRHVSGKQFSVWMFSSMENAGKQFSYFLKAFPKEFIYLPLLIAVMGLVRIYRKNVKLFWFTFILFVFNVIYAINYDIYDIDSYFLLAYITCSIWVGYGLLAILEKVKENTLPVSIAALLIALLPLTQNFSKADKSQNYFVRDYTMNVFNSVPQNSIIISTQWDFFVSASIYYQNVKNIRPDLIIIDKELLRKSWYLDYIKMHYPQIFNKSRGEFDVYNVEVLKFEKNSERYTAPKTEQDKQDLLKIQTAFLNLFNSILDKNYETNKFYTTFEVEQVQGERFGNSYKRIPQGVLVNYSKEAGFDNYTEPDMHFEITSNDDYHHKFLMDSYFNAFLSRANYLMNFAKLDEAEALLQKAAQIYPGRQEPVMTMNKIKQMRATSEPK